MKVVLLDRDGTVIADPPDERVDTIDKIQLFADSIEALRLLAAHDFAIILITNQAGIAEGRINQREFEIINDRVLAMLAPSGVRVLKTFVCPHGPADNCECRKPKPTMILQAAKEFALDLEHTYMVGDRQSDIMAGVNAGARTVFVRTAHVQSSSDGAEYSASSLLDAAKYVVEHSAGAQGG
jgi:histidinol-phosphate phosphatase family protein